MQAAPIIAISALLIGFVLLAFSLFAYHMLSKRRKDLEQLARRDIDQKTPTRILTVMDGKVVPMQRQRWASTFNGIHWPTYSMDQQGSKSAEQPAQNLTRDLAAAGNDTHRRTPDMQPQLHLLQQTSHLLGSPVYSPLAPSTRTRATREKRKKGQYQLEQTQPPKYGYAIKSPISQVYDTASPRTVQHESHRSTIPSQVDVQVSTRNDNHTSIGGAEEPLPAHSLSTNPQLSLSTSEPYRIRRSSNKEANDSIPRTSGAANPDLNPIPLRSLPPIIKGLPLSPIRTPEEEPAVPVGSKPSVHPNSPKPSFDMNVLEAASVSAIPPSAFYPYRFPPSGSRQPRRSYRAILKSTAASVSLVAEAVPETVMETKDEQIGIAFSPDSGVHNAVSRPSQSVSKTEFPPRISPMSHGTVPANSTRARPSDSEADIAALSWLADPSLSVSPNSSGSSRHRQQHHTSTPKTSGESDRVHRSFLNPDTPPSGSVPYVRPEQEQSPVPTRSPYGSSNIAQAYHMGNARCVSIYSRFANPVQRKPVPTQLAGEPYRLSSQSAWRDKPLPSPRSDGSGKAASATAPSFVVSPLSSVFTP